MELTNWGGNHMFAASRLHRPSTVEQVQELAAAAPRLRALGSRHSFSDISDAPELVTVRELPDEIVLDRAANTVEINAGLSYGELAGALAEEGLALANLASLPHIAVGGAIATATHGSGDHNGNLATAVTGLELVTSAGELLRVQRGDPNFNGMVVGLGALGIVTRVTLAVEPAYPVWQRVYERLSWDALFANFDEVTATGYSVSVFTRWDDDLADQMWVKSRTGDPGATPLFGAAAATTQLHPLADLDPVNCTRQLGEPGPWFDRLPHFRMGFTPSAGAEIQSEWLIPRRHAVAATEALRGHRELLAPLVQVSEIRTIAADELWMSTAYGRETVGLHFTWVLAPAAVARAVTVIERVLAPYAARPHWGKLFGAGAHELAPLYERHADFAALVARLDPRGAFRNDWLERHVLA